MTYVARQGFRVVTPRIVTTDVDGVVSFLRRVFGASGESFEGRPSEIRIGDSWILVSEAGGEREPFPAFLYVYVDTVEKVFARAVSAGAVVLEEPLDTPYGDRRAMVRDPFGNIWQIAHVIH
jgi:uncharacterized glyoxalase superfamily protein PhnB